MHEWLINHGYENVSRILHYERLGPYELSFVEPRDLYFIGIDESHAKNILDGLNNISH